MSVVEQWNEKKWESDPDAAIKALGAFIDDASITDAKGKENAVYLLSDIHRSRGDVASLGRLVRSCRPFLGTVPKARAGKIVRVLLDRTDTVVSNGGDRSNSSDAAGLSSVHALVEMCREIVEWCVEEKRIFLMQRVQCRLASAQLRAGEPQEALRTAEALSRELRKLDDKALLLETQLVESKAHFALKDLPKAKATLTSARTTANTIYCPPQLQSELDLQSGVILAEEGDFNTGYSYFFEAFETKHGLDDPEAVRSLKYMLLCKVMNGKSGEVQAVANSKNAVGYTGSDVEAMRSVAESYAARSIHDFEACLKKFPTELEKDAVVHTHLKALYDELLVQNLSRLIEPFSRVQIAHIAELINLPVPFVEQKLSQMILDKQLDGILDQGAGDLIVFDPREADKMYDGAIDTVASLDAVVDSLFARAACLT